MVKRPSLIFILFGGNVMNCKCKKVMVVIPGSVDLYRCEVWREIISKMPVI